MGRYKFTPKTASSPPRSPPI